MTTRAHAPLSKRTRPSPSAHPPPFEHPAHGLSASRIPHLLPAFPAGIPVQPVPPLPLQRKLAIGSSDDPLEHEADRAARAALNPHASQVPARTPGRVAPALTQAPPLVHRVLRSPGRRLDDSTRSWAESAFQSGFGDVRLHTGPEAEQSAAQVRAHAYTVGSHIVLGPGRSEADRPLVAHELAHVVQQGMAPPQPAARQAPARAALPHRASAPLVQRQDADDTRGRNLGWVTEKLIDAASAPALAIGDTAYDLVHATWHGFVAEIKDHGGDAADKVWDHFKDFVTSPKQLLMFFPKYWWGLIKGIFSPITGLFDLGKLVIQLGEIGAHAAASAWENRDKIAGDAEALATSMGGMWGKAKTALKGLWEHPIDTITALGPLLDEAKSQANGAAERGGHKIANMLLAATDRPIPDLAEVGGEAIGTVVVNVALFILTDGIGDAIVQIAGRLGEVAGWLAKFGKAAEMLGGIVAKLGELLTTVGGWVTRAEAFIGKMISTVLKPLEPVLEEFGGLMGKLRTFLRDLLGVAEKEGAQEASAAAKAIKGATKETPALKPPEPPPAAKPPAPKPEVKPHLPETKPHVPEPKPHVPEPEPKPHVPEPSPHEPAAKPQTAESQPHAPEKPAAKPERKPAQKPRAEPKKEPRQVEEPAPRKPAKPKRPRDPAKPQKPSELKQPAPEEPTAPAKPARTKKPPLDSKAQMRAKERLRQQKAAHAGAIHEYHGSAEKIIELEKKVPGLVEKAKAVPAPASLAKEQQELRAIEDFQEKLERLREIRSSRSNWSDAEKKYFDSREELWQAQEDLEAARHGLERAKAGQVEADIQVPEAERALRKASQRISEILRGEGPNFKSVSKLKFDQTLGEDTWKALATKPSLETEHLVSVREIEDTINHSELPSLHSEASPAIKSEMEKEFQKLGDIRENLTRMRRDANNFKSDRSWHDISYQDAAKFGYTKEMLDGLREVESAQRVVINKRISDMVEEFTKRIRGH